MTKFVNTVELKSAEQSSHTNSMFDSEKSIFSTYK